MLERRQGHLLPPSPGGGGSTPSVSDAAGWGEFCRKKVHPTPLASLATLPLQGRVNGVRGSANKNNEEQSHA